VVKSNELTRTIQIKDRAGKVVGTKEVVTYQGLLSKAHEEGLAHVATKLLQIPTEENGRTAVARALVETKKGRFEALGDASPENVNSFIVPHLIRMAETRAKARALRDAVNVGVLSFEELDGESTFENGTDPAASPPSLPPPAQPASRDADDRMTEAQRRYLFRILAGRGVEAQAAHEYLKDAFGMPTLAEVGKRDASDLIDRLLSESAEGAIDGTHQR
jgi:hypothetical protein